MNKRVKPSLSDYDVSNFDDYESMQSSTWDKSAGAYRVRATHEIDSSDTIGSRNCWCGKPASHDWPGRKDKTPHPRDRATS